MAGPPTKRPKTDNDEVLGRVQDHDSLIEGASGSDDSVTVTAAAGLDDDDGSSSSDNEDKRPTARSTPSDSGVEMAPQTQIAPVIGKRKRYKKPKKSTAVIDSSLDDDNGGT